MRERKVYWSIDLVAVAAANLMNIIMVVVVVLRSMRVKRLWVGGLVWVALALVLAVVVTLNVAGLRGQVRFPQYEAPGAVPDPILRVHPGHDRVFVSGAAEVRLHYAGDVLPQSGRRFLFLPQGRTRVIDTTCPTIRMG